MTFGLRARIVLIASGAMLFAAGSIIAVSGYVFTREYAAALQSRSLAIATGLKVQLERVLQLGIPLENLIGFEEQAQEAVKAYAGIAYAMVVAPDGRILFHSEPARSGQAVDEPEVLEAVRSGVQAAVRHFHGAGGGPENYAAIVPVFDGQGSYRASIVVDVPAHLIAAKVNRMVAFIDMDNFKVINDSLGHNLGDVFLKTIAARLSRSVREVDAVTRFGGDEFVVVLFDQPQNNDSVIPLLERLQNAVTQPVTLAGREYTLTSSIGFATFPQDGSDAETLLRNADEAMYRAKELGRNNFQPYSEDLHARFTERLALHNGLRRALERGEFLVRYQPQSDLRSGTIVAVEASGAGPGAARSIHTRGRGDRADRAHRRARAARGLRASEAWECRRCGWR